MQSFVDASEAVGAAVAQAAEACKLSAAEMETAEQLATAGGQLGAHMKKKVGGFPADSTSETSLC